jgi:hypothetical protein
MKLACLLTLVAGSAYALTDAQVDEMYTRAAASYIQKALQQREHGSSKTALLIVPTAAVAEAIHAAVEGAVHGQKHIDEERPFRTVRSGDFWVVFGTLPQTVLGSTAVTVIRASTGEVLLMTHE